MANLQMAQAEQGKLGLPPGYRLLSPFPWGSMNQSDSRVGMGDNELFWIENLFKDGNGKIRSLYDVGTLIYTAAAGRTIVSFFFYNIGSTQYAIVFLDNGTAVQVNVATKATTTVSSTINTFYKSATGQLPGLAQSGAQYLLICNNNTANDYWMWDGAVLYSAGSVSPVVTIQTGGTGYSSAPTATAYGGSGSGVTATAIVAQNSVTQLIITAAGSSYAPTDVVAFQFSGGGSDTGATFSSSISGGVIGSLTVVNEGSGGTPGTYALTFSGGGGSGAAGTYTVGALGNITGVVLSNGGSGYTSTPTVGFGGGSGITGASVVAALKPGAVSSVSVTAGGSGYKSTPTLLVVGGGGFGAQLTATISGGAVTGVTVVNGGSGYITAPTVVAIGGNNAAAAIANMMPFGISGTTIETFSSRVIIANPFQQTGAAPAGGTFNISAPQSLTNFATSSGGLQFISNDRFLRAQYVVMRQSNGYLYPFGDSSVSVISNIQTSGSPPSTTFNYQNVDPQVGIAWRDSCVDFGRTSLFANQLGVFGLYGGAVTKVSTKMDDIFANMVLPANGGVTPSSAVVNIRGMKIFLMLITSKDTTTNTTRTFMIGWDQTNWFVASQSVSLTYIGLQEQNSNLTAWGTDGKSLYPMLSTPSSTLQKKVSSKLYGGQDLHITKQARAYYVQAIDQSANSAGISFNLSIDTENGSTAVPPSGTQTGITLPGQAPPNGPSTQIAMGQVSDDIIGQQLGFTITSTSPDFDLINVAIGYTPEAAYYN